MPEQEQIQPHECQNGCGRRAGYVLMDLEERTSDLICGICLMVMMAAAAKLQAEQEPEVVAAVVAAG